MTNAAQALAAINDMGASRHLHIDILETMRSLRMSTDEAVELRRLVAREWRTADGDRREILSLAKTVVNQYARDYRLR